MPRLISKRSPWKALAGETSLQLAAGVLIVLSLVLITVPVSDHQRYSLQREQCIQSLAWIAAAKEDLTQRKSLTRGTVVTLPQLMAESKILQETPIFPPGVKPEINPIGIAPDCVFRGEKLTPLADFNRNKLFETI